MAVLNLINGTWTSASRTMTQANPATGEVLVEAPLSGAEEVEAAVAAAREAFPGWAATPAPTRGEILFKAAAIIERDAQALARSIAEEVGKPIKEAVGEVARTAVIFRYFAGEGRRLGSSMLPSDTGDVTLTIREPLGVVGLITPWNFPLAIPAWKLGPALIAGNSIVLKAAEQASRGAAQLVATLEEAGLPAGVLNLVLGEAEAGRALVAHHDVAAISFTGSTEAGNAVRAEAAKRGARAQVEMGGKNVAIVLRDADVSRAAASVAGGAFGFAGQKCTATGLCLVEAAISDQFIEALTKATEATVVGSPLDEATACGPVIDQAALERACSLGAQAASDRGWFPRPTLLLEEDVTSPVATQEQFVPVLPVHTVRGLDEALRIADALPTGLSAGLHTNDAAAIWTFLKEMRAGVLAVNRPTTGLEVQAPFGGLKASGSEHKEQGAAAVEFYTEIKTAYWSA